MLMSNRFFEDQTFDLGEPAAIHLTSPIHPGNRVTFNSIYKLASHDKDVTISTQLLSFVPEEVLTAANLRS